MFLTCATIHRCMAWFCAAALSWRARWLKVDVWTLSVGRAAERYRGTDGDSESVR